jgi:hypothetical protein
LSLVFIGLLLGFFVSANFAPPQKKQCYPEAGKRGPEEHRIAAQTPPFLLSPF